MPPAEIIVCTTCRGPGRVDGVGAAFAGELARLAAGPAYAGVTVTPAVCLWSCGQGASAQLRSAERTGYVMGGFVAADAAALLDFAAVYAGTSDGEVPYDRWPPGVLGHFIARTPPPGATFG